jgi:hypothetical protein
VDSKQKIEDKLSLLFDYEEEYQEHRVFLNLKATSPMQAYAKEGAYLLDYTRAMTAKKIPSPTTINSYFQAIVYLLDGRCNNRNEDDMVVCHPSS